MLLLLLHSRDYVSNGIHKRRIVVARHVCETARECVCVYLKRSALAHYLSLSIYAVQTNENIHNYYCAACRVCVCVK